MKADNTNIDTAVTTSDFSSYNSTLDLTEEQKEVWLWEEYISKHASFSNEPIW